MLGHSSSRAFATRITIHSTLALHWARVMLAHLRLRWWETQGTSMCPPLSSAPHHLQHACAWSLSLAPLSIGYE